MQINIPALLRIKRGIIGRIGVYLERERRSNVVLLYGEGIRALFGERVSASCGDHGIEVLQTLEVADNSLERIIECLVGLPSRTEALVAIGGGKTVDFGKYLGFLKKLPVIAVPTALSNDGMASPTASLLIKGVRHSMKAKTPEGVVIDTDVVLSSPERYTYSGIGDMIGKVTAIYDWKLAFHETREPVNDFSVLVAQQSVDAVLTAANEAEAGTPVTRNREFIEKLAGSLVMSGVAMEICGSSRPASGAEHLISHAYDRIFATPHLHGVQVGVASYATSWLQQNRFHDTLIAFLDRTGFWRFVSEHPLKRADFEAAIRLAPSLRSHYYTILNRPDALDRLVEFTRKDGRMKAVLV